MTTDDRAREAAEHLQAAALELIAASRVVLDGLEDLVRDPSPLVAAAASAAARGRAAAAAADRRGPSARGDEPPGGPRVQRIRVS